MTKTNGKSRQQLHLITEIGMSGERVAYRMPGHDLPDAPLTEVPDGVDNSAQSVKSKLK